MIFLTWYMEWKKEYPGMRLSQSKEVYDEIFVKNRIQWMGGLAGVLMKSGHFRKSGHRT